MRVQNPVHGSNGTQLNALIEQACIDFGGCEIDEARFAQKVQHGPAFIGVQSASRFCAWPRRQRGSRAAMQTGA